MRSFPATMAVAAGLLVLAAAAKAQTAATPAIPGSSSGTSSGTMSSGTNWGTAAGAGTSAADSAAMHVQAGNLAGQANAAKNGILLNAGPGVLITAIGSQNVVSTTILGDNNTTNVTATQSSTNSGTVSSNGSVALAPGSTP